MGKFLHFVIFLNIFITPDFLFAETSLQDSSVEDSLNFIEKVYLHTDRDRYNTGDDIWFKAYLVDGSNLLTDNSFNLHAELISPQQKIVDSRIVRLTNGLGNGDFKVPENLRSGFYKLRAYTNYMRNFDSRYFFSKELIIINPADSGKMYGDSISYVNSKPEVSFFPEGGSLVDYVPSLVAFKATDATGKGCEVNGKIFSSTGELVTETRSIHKGMGRFSLTPEQGKTYYSVFYDQLGDSVRTELPKSFPEGLVLNLSDNNDGFINLTIRTNPQTLEQFSGRELSLSISAQTTEYKRVTFRMKTINSKMNLPSTDIPDGVVKLTIAGPDKKPLCERLIFISNNGDVRVHIETNKPAYNQRDSLSLNLSLSENTRTGGTAWLSLAAAERISLSDRSAYPSTIASWFLLESDIRGNVEDPGYYFDPSNADRLKNLDLLLLTQGWRDFQWKYNNQIFRPETGFSVTGRARKKFADEPVNNSSINIGIFRKGKPLIAVLPTDSAGRFLLKNIEINGEANIIASITSDKDKLKGWLILDSLKYIPAPAEMRIKRKELSVSESLPDSADHSEKSLPAYIQYAKIKRSVLKKYKLSDTINIGEVTITARRQEKAESPRARSERYLMTVMPDIEYKIEKESEIYNNLGFLLKNRFHISYVTDPIIPAPRSSERSPGLSLSSSARASGNFSPVVPRRPIIMLNGMEVDWESVSFLPIDWVERVDILIPRNAEMIWGDRGKDGVISVITKREYTSTKKVMHSANVKISGYNEPRIFYSPKHHTTLEKDYKPDFRTTLFWEPNIELDADKQVVLNYFNADNASRVNIVVEGITSSGIPVTGKTEYEVK